MTSYSSIFNPDQLVRRTSKTQFTDAESKMLSEKQALLDDVQLPVRPSSRSQSRRKNFLIAFGVGLILLSSFAVGINVSKSCQKVVKEGLQHVRSTIASVSSDFLTQSHQRRSVNVNMMLDLNPALGVATKTRPHKFFGPTASVQEEAILRAARLKISVSKREELLETADSIEIRDNLEKRAVWQPAPGLNWTYQLNQPPTQDQLKNPRQYQVWGIDLFDTPASSIQTIQAAGSKVICYFSGGTFEDWRTDSWKFSATDKGNAMGDWPGETWINTNSLNIRRIMAARLDLAKQKGCDGVDPDNMDGYNHDTGFNLQMSDTVSYVTYLAKQASSRGLAISLKNAGDVIPKVVNLVQYSIEEACTMYSECDIYKPFITAGKAVFHVEYPKGYGVVNTDQVNSTTMTPICACSKTYNLSPIVKNNNLDTWQQQC